MTMPPGLRKAALTAHVVSSVGWLGAVLGSLALAVTALATEKLETIRSVYVALELMSWWVLVPLALASLLTGLMQALGTSWGLFRHYWVIVKLLMNLLATVVLLLYLETLSELADVASDMSPTSAELDTLRTPSPVLHSAAALVLLLVATTLSIYKPRGMTRYGRKREQNRAVRT